jgi:hypothetical protein
MSVYEIRVKGPLDPRWSEWFDGLQVTNEPNGEALLSGYIADQAALHGVLAKVRDLNLQLNSGTSVHTDRQRAQVTVEPKNECLLPPRILPVRHRQPRPSGSEAGSPTTSMSAGATGPRRTPGGRGAERQPSRTARSSWRRRAGSATTSISVILPSVIVKPSTRNSCPRGPSRVRPLRLPAPVG